MWTYLRVPLSNFVCPRLVELFLSHILMIFLNTTYFDNWKRLFCVDQFIMSPWNNSA